MSLGHRTAWVFGIACLVLLVINAVDHQWGWVVAMGCFVVATALTLWRYYMWPRRIRRP